MNNLMRTARRLHNLLFFLPFLTPQALKAQTSFDLQVTEVSLPNMPTVHSGVAIPFHQYWIFIGGRTNGLHGFQTGSGFPIPGANKNIMVYNPYDYTVHTVDLLALPDSLQEFLSGSNSLFDVAGDQLYLAGGYGYRAATQSFGTYPYLARINLPLLVNIVLTGQGNLASCIQCTYLADAAVTGSHLKVGNNALHVFCGHRFEGTYSQNDTAGFFQQTYLPSIRSIFLSNSVSALQVDSVSAISDSVHHRRRDFNLSPFYYAGANLRYLVSGGGFTKITNHLIHSVTLFNPQNRQGFVDGFSTNFNLYHCATLPIYDSVGDAMHAVYFGGISDHFRLQNGTIAEDTLAPFVKTISRISRLGANPLQESLFDAELPDFLGSNATFFPMDTARFDQHGVFRIPEVLPNDNFIDLGYITGGIESPLPHISSTDPSVSIASARAFKVRMNFNVLNGSQSQDVSNAVSVFPTQEPGLYRIQNAGNGSSLSVFSITGQLLEQSVPSYPSQGNSSVDLRPFGPGCYLIRLSTPHSAHAVKLMYGK
jgi:hypothetical protein